MSRFCCSVAQLSLTLCDPMDCSTPGFHVHHWLPKLPQTHVHWISGAIQPSCPVLSPSFPSFNLSHHSVQFSSVAQSCLTLCDPMDCSTPGFHVHQVSDAIQPSHPLYLLLLLPSIFPSIRVFSSKSFLCIRWPKYWSFSFIISPSNEYSKLIPFKIDWLDLLAVQGTPFSNTTVQKHQFFATQLSL